MISVVSYSRRKMIKTFGALAAAGLLRRAHPSELLDTPQLQTPKISAHLWVYASKYPPKWDATPDMEEIFRDVHYAGYDGLELMSVNLMHEDAVERIRKLSDHYRLPVSGASFGGDMWNVQKHESIGIDAEITILRLAQLNGKTLGISVGDAKRKKTEGELDAQADMLRRVFALCQDHGIEPNLHNHTYEVVDGMHDLKGTLTRLPDAKLGPDLNWLIRGGVNPVQFINTYGKQIVYLHIRDQYASGVWTEYLGQGVTDFPSVASALKANGFEGRAAVELAFPDQFTLTKPLKEDWKISRNYVRTTFGW